MKHFLFKDEIAFAKDPETNRYGYIDKKASGY